MFFFITFIFCFYFEYINFDFFKYNKCLMYKLFRNTIFIIIIIKIVLRVKP